MLTKIIKYSSVILASFYIGNTAPINLPKPEKLQEFINEIAGSLPESAQIAKYVDGAKEYKPQTPQLHIDPVQNPDLENRIEEPEKAIDLKTVLKIEDEPAQIPKNQTEEAEFYIPSLEKYMVELVNKERELHSLERLKYNIKIAKAAEQHSQEMMELGYFEHESPVPKYKELADRIRLAEGDERYRCGENISCAENIAYHGSSNCMEENDEQVITDSMADLMESGGHRANILNPNFDHIGIGIATKEQNNGTRLWYITQNFIAKDSNVTDIERLARCLTEKEIKFYGVEWCGYCKKQKELFGDSFGYIDYVDCDINKQECNSLNITGYPTWLIDGKSYPGIRSLEDLKELSGCN